MREDQRAVRPWHADRPRHVKTLASPADAASRHLSRYWLSEHHAGIGVALHIHIGCIIPPSLQADHGVAILWHAFCSYDRAPHAEE
jgi:hypothetical protein